MSKIKPILIVLALLALLAATPALADLTQWVGGGDGSCGGHAVFEPWEGDLYTTGTQGSFYGFWGNNEENLMEAENVDQIVGTDYWDVIDGAWDSGGWDVYYYGTWDGYFRKVNGDAWGTWLGTNIQCSGDWAGIKP